MKTLFSFLFAISLATNVYIINEYQNLNLLFEKRLLAAEKEAMTKGREITDAFWKEEHLPRIKEAVYTNTMAQAEKNCNLKLEDKLEEWNNEKEKLNEIHLKAKRHWHNEKGNFLIQIDSFLEREEELLVSLQDLRQDRENDEQSIFEKPNTESSQNNNALGIRLAAAKQGAGKWLLVAIVIGLVLICIFFLRFGRDRSYV